MVRYYLGRGLQLIGLVVTAHSLIMHFGDMGPMLKKAIIGIAVFYLGRFVQGGYR
ncbi:MAG: hypothetical protein HYR55_05385 [Acidobacteria bacterium]|nr:hypothetical protein [Acidobacteriota bacterium]MBI3657823.1 hypothetical protein [Acidobacteriota bacterium]